MTIPLLVGGLVVVFGSRALGVNVSNHKTPQSDLKQADVPPAEFVYLDTPRVLSYLAQLEGGLTSAVRQKVGVNDTASAGLSPASVATLSRTVEQQLSSEETVTPTVASRYSRFERLIRLDRGTRKTLKHPGRWLTDLEMTVTADAPAQGVRNLLAGLPNGYFVRLQDARLCVPAYVALLAKLADLPTCEPRKRRLEPPLSRVRLKAAQSGLKRYRRRLGQGLTVPLIVQTLPFERKRGRPGKVASFVLLADYRALTADPAFLSGVVTVVAKAVNTDAAGGSAKQSAYVDREALVSFTSALARAPASLRRAAGLPARGWRRAVRRSLRVPPPMAVVAPIAIYK
jgi:hypothetical protein